MRKKKSDPEVKVQEEPYPRVNVVLKQTVTISKAHKFSFLYVDLDLNEAVAVRDELNDMDIERFM